MDNSARLPLIGREQLLRRLVEAHGRVLDGERIMATIVGERGSGRSRLLRALRSEPELRDALVLDLRVEQGPDALERAVERALHSELVVRRAIVPSAPGGIPIASGASLAERLSLLGSVLPLVFELDDLGGGDRRGIELGALLRAVDAPWLVVTTSDPVGAGEAMAAARTAEARVVELHCGTFDHEEITALLRSMLESEPDPCDVAWLLERTHGLPLLLREAIEAAVRSGALVRDGGRLRRVDAINRGATEYEALLPMTVSELRLVGAAEHEALAATALLGQTIPERFLAEFSIGEEEIDRLVELRLLRREQGALHFESRLVREAGLALAATLRIDGRHAATLARVVPEGIETGELAPPARTIALLVRGASDDASRAHLASAMLATGRRFAARGEYEYAGVLMGCCYDVALELVDDSALAAEWFESYASVLHTLGRDEDQRRVVDAYLARHELATCAPSLVPTIVRGLLWRAEHDERHKQIDAALAVLDAADAAIARIEDAGVAAALAHRATIGRGRLYGVAERHDEAFTLLRGLVDGIDAEKNLPAAFDAVLVLSRMARTPERRAEAERRVEELHARFVTSGPERLTVQLAAARIGLHYDDDGFDRYEPEIRALLERTRRLSLPRTETNIWSWLSMILADRGELDESLRAIDNAIEMRWRIGSIAFWQTAMINRSQILALARRDDEALATVDEVELDARTYGRPCRRYLIEHVRRTVAVRRGEWPVEGDGLEELAAIAQDEGFSGASFAMLQLEGEMLLHTPAIDRDRAGDYARRVLDENPIHMATRRLLVAALAVLARAHDDAATAARGRSGAGDPLLEELRGRVAESISFWLARGARANVEQALTLLRAHAPRALSVEELPALEAMTPGGAAGQQWHHCEVRTFGAVRVVDAAGVERGGRHFGQHKSDSKPKKMLAALAVAAILGRRLKRERLIDMVWGESVTPEAAVNNFHVTLSGLRQVVGDVVDFDGASYTLNTSLARVDALCMITQVDDAMRLQRSGLLFRTFELLRTALMAADGGEFLDGIYDEWTDGARDRVRSTIRTARIRIAEIALARGERELARRQIGELLDVDPLDEEAELLQLSLMRLEGERLRALREYDRFAERLEAELGAGPSKRLRALRISLAEG